MAIVTKIRTLAKRWYSENDAVAAMEAAFVFPILLVLLLGTFDMGNAILSNQKAIRASQVVADLVTRSRSISSGDLNEAIKAGELAFAPLSSTSYGVDIVSLRFDEDADPQIVWRETRNMSPKSDVLDAVEALAEADSGVVVVSVQYAFEPVFAGFVINRINMQEIAFARGRKSAVVARD